MSKPKSKKGFMRPDRIGPMSVADVIRCLRKLINSNASDIGQAAGDFARGIENGLQKRLVDTRHTLIKETFEDDRRPTLMNPFVRIYQEIQRHPDKSPPSLEGCCKSPLEATPDYFACYVPECAAKHWYGIYFCANRFVNAVASQGLPVELLVRTVAVHELFHGFVEMSLGAEECAHRHRGEPVDYCRLEEAAANYVARNWLLSQKSTPRVDVRRVDEFLFSWAKLTSPPVPGYGEFCLVDETVAELVPRLIADGMCDPQTYRQASVLNRAYPGGQSPHGEPSFVARLRDGRVWQALVDNLDVENVPCYVTEIP